MAGDGPSGAELGIITDVTSETKKQSSVVLPELNQVYERQQLPPQEAFSNKVTNMVLSPARAELHNGNLANFLTNLNGQQGLGDDKLGVVIFLNDTKEDSQKRPHIIDENQLTAQFLSFLAAKDHEGIMSLDLPDNYKDLAQKIIDKDQLEIRFDYMRNRSDVIHFGRLRTHLFNLANTFKNPSVPDQDIITHLSDIDIDYSNRHFANLKHFYENHAHLANISDEDFIPNINETPEAEDMGRDLLTTLDEFRFYRYFIEAQDLFKGKVRSGTPMISGRLSYFFSEDKLKPQFADALQKLSNEDFKLGTAMRSDQDGESIGNVGEVYRIHRARRPKALHSAWAHTDAEEAFLKVKEIKETGGTSGYNYINDWDTLLGKLDQYVIKAGGTQEYRHSDEYRQLLLAEMKSEEMKIRLRRVRLLGYIKALSDKQELTQTEQKALVPFLQYFGDETNNIKHLLNDGQSEEQVGVHYLQKYDAFFNANSQIHIQIATLRAIKKYAFAHNLVAEQES
jgi:hypothetical protein